MKKLLIVFFIFCVSCDFSKTEKKENVKQAKTFSQKIKKGPLDIHLKITPKNPTLADKIYLTLEVLVAKKYTVKMPDFGESFGRNFFIYNFYQRPVEIKDKKKKYYQSYQLEALDSGKIKIPAIKFRYQQNKKVEEKNSYLAQVDPIPFEIKKVKKSDLKGLSDIRQQKSLTTPTPKYIYVLFVVAIVLIAILWVLSKRKPKKNQEVIFVSPEEYAWKSLQALLEKDYINSKDYRLFYFELTMIVCKFIEGKYNINAPGQTTEEFLHTIANSDIFDAITKKNLQEFMEAADIVKYAAHTPTASDIEISFEKAKKFMGIENS